jgi:hypothetical protein
LILSSELIRMRRRKGLIFPLYATDDHLGLSKTLVSVHEEYLGKMRGDLKDALVSCEELGHDYKLVRGLSALLEERCSFESRAVVSPADARRAVFEEASGRVVDSEAERNRVLSTVAFRLGVSVINLDRSLYADLQAEQELVGFDRVTPLDLLMEYNFSLVLALLLYAVKFELSYRGRDKGILELAGKLGKCSVGGLHESQRVTVELGSVRGSGYRASQFEEIVSLLTSKRDWTLSAYVRYPVSAGKTYRLEVSHDGDGVMIKPRLRRETPLVRPAPRVTTAIKVKRDIVDVLDTAMKLGVTETEVVEQLEGKGFLDIGGVMITQGKLLEVREAIESAPDMRFDTLRRLLRGLGCRNPVQLLEALGYTVEWNRDRGQSLVYRVGGKRKVGRASA